MGSQFFCFFLWILRLIGENPVGKGPDFAPQSTFDPPP
ncbi:hypothetical protein SLEP1_g49607 [Rubroshorea leprosula]|uniref:Uncharacterized protein n=1 Tax=Rubroshorea leprosula TaxID=152421 RepID=A0AAV5LXB5_9ROSI|nr:hypothetical protein SLEP1_g49607 [Rubroshorea leprosula]